MNKVHDTIGDHDDVRNQVILFKKKKRITHFIFQNANSAIYQVKLNG